MITRSPASPVARVAGAAASFGLLDLVARRLGSATLVGCNAASTTSQIVATFGRRGLDSVLLRDATVGLPIRSVDVHALAILPAPPYQRRHSGVVHRIRQKRVQRLSPLHTRRRRYGLAACHQAWGPLGSAGKCPQTDPRGVDVPHHRDGASMMILHPVATVTEPYLIPRYKVLKISTATAFVYLRARRSAWIRTINRRP